MEEVVLFKGEHNESTAILSDGNIIYQAYLRNQRVASVYLIREELEAMIKIIDEAKL